MERINFREQADLGMILQKSAQFIRQNFIGIMKSSLLIILLPLLLGTFLLANSTMNLYAVAEVNMNNPSDILSLYTGLLPGYFCVSIAFMLFYISCVSYIKQYANGVEVINQNTVFAELKKHILTVFFGGFLVAILAYVGVILCVFPGIYLAIVFSHIFCIVIIEDKGFGTAFNRSFKIIKGNWWNSFALYFVSTIISGAISFVMLLPAYIYSVVVIFMGVTSEDPNLTGLGNAAGGLVLFSMLAYIVSFLIMATIQSANYYNLIERQEGVGEKLDIESFGN